MVASAHFLLFICHCILYMHKNSFSFLNLKNPSYSAFMEPISLKLVHSEVFVLNCGPWVDHAQHITGTKHSAMSLHKGRVQENIPRLSQMKWGPGTQPYYNSTNQLLIHRMFSKTSQLLYSVDPMLALMYMLHPH